MTKYKELARRWYRDVMENGKVELIDEMTAPGFIEHEALPGLPGGAEGVRAYVEMMRTAFPDMKVTVEDMIEEGDRVAARVTFHGTHKGELFGLKPTGKHVDVTGYDFVRFDDGRAIEHWGLTDTASMMEQLGVSAGLPG